MNITCFKNAKCKLELAHTCTCTCTIFVYSIIILYKLDTVLLKQKQLPISDITGFFFCMTTQAAFTRVLMRKMEPFISNTGRFFCVDSTVSYTCLVHYWSHDKSNMLTNTHWSWTAGRRKLIIDLLFCRSWLWYGNNLRNRMCVLQHHYNVDIILPVYVVPGDTPMEYMLQFMEHWQLLFAFRKQYKGR